MGKAYFETPLGYVELCGDDEGIESISFVDTLGEDVDVSACMRECKKQLKEYFDGSRKSFSIRLKPKGTDFQKQVWKQLMDIPYGSMASYRNIAEKVGNIKAVRAVGGANRRNPLPIVVPCHRVIGSDGSLTGYAGGLWRKKWLLEHENKALGGQLE